MMSHTPYIFEIRLLEVYGFRFIAAFDLYLHTSPKVRLQISLIFTQTAPHRYYTRVFCDVV